MYDLNDAAAIAKELRVTQAAIRGFAGFLAAGETDPARKHCLASILETAAAMDRIIAQLEGGPAGAADPT